MRAKKKLSPLVIIFMTGLIVYFLVTFFQQRDEISIIVSEMRVLQNKIDQEKETQEKLLEQQSKLESDEFIESIAREKLGMVKSGERLFVAD